MMDWNARKKQEQERAKREEDGYYAQQARLGDQKRRDKEDALAEYFR